MNRNDEAPGCREAREGLTEYLEDALARHARQGVETHLAACPECRRLLDELRATAHLLGRQPREAVPDARMQALLRAMRDRQSA